MSICRPATLEELISNIKELLELGYKFSFQYKDPEFNHELCNLTDIADLPEKPTKLSPYSSWFLAQHLQKAWMTTSVQQIQRSSHSYLMSFFYIPCSSVDLEYRLRQANLLYLSDGTLLKVTKYLKHEILKKLAENMYGVTAYPNNDQFESVAAALINKHPCLQEKGSTSDYSGWKNSLKYKIANYKSKLRQSSCLNVVVNAGRYKCHSTPGEPANKNLKKAKKGELNYSTISCNHFCVT